MTDLKRTCPADHESSALLDYLDEGPRGESGTLVESHISDCPQCARALTALREMDSLLRNNPDVFHPADTELYEFVIKGTDPDGMVSLHLTRCQDCRDAADLLKEILDIGSGIPTPSPTIPTALRKRLQEIHGVWDAPTGAHGRQEAVRQLQQWLGWPWRLPTLAVGTALAVLLVIVVGPRMWSSFVQHERSSGGAASVEFSRTSPKLTEPKESGQVQLGAVPSANVELEKKKASLADQSNIPTSPPDAKKLEKGGPGSIAVEPPRTPRIPEATKQDQRRSVSEILPDKQVFKQAVPPERAPMSAPSPASLSPSPSKAAPSAPSDAINGARDERDAFAPGSPAGEVRKHKESSNKPARLRESEARHGLIPVRVDIVDQNNVPVAWLAYSPDADMALRYTFVPAHRDRKADAEDKAEVPMTFHAARPAQESPPGLTVLVRVLPAGEAVNLEARLIDSSSGTEKKTIAQTQIPRDKVSETLRQLVRSLLDHS